MAAACAAALLCAASAALAAQRYASPAGSGSTCSQASPCPIQTAVSGAGTGDEVIVTPGDYTGLSTTIEPFFSDIYVHGVQGQPMPRLHFTSGYLAASNLGDRLSYMAVDGTSTVPLQVGSTGGTGSADQMYAHSTGTSTSACYDYSSLIDSVCWASGANSPGVSGSASATYTVGLRNVTAEGTGSGGAGVFYSESGAGTLTINAANVIARGAGDDIALNEIPGATLVADIDHANHVSLTPSGSPTITETNQQTALPLFVNAAAGNFDEAPTSPTINAGVTSTQNGAFDILGKPRTINGLTDIGAYEHDPFTGVDLRNQPTRVKKRKAKVAVGCPAGTPVSCNGSLTLTFGRKTAGSTGFSIPAGVVRFLKVKVSKKTLKKVRKKGRLATTATASATDGAGTRATATARVKLKR